MTRLVHVPEVTMLLQSNLIEGEPGLEALSDAIDAWDFLNGYKNLTHAVVLTAHGILMQGEHLKHPLEGKYQARYRDLPVYIDGQEAPHHKLIRPDLDQLFEYMNNTRAHAPRSDEGRQSWARYCHVKFEKIHPFVDGNGRMGRMLYNWHLLKLEQPVDIIDADNRREYYDWFKEDVA